MPIGNNTNDNTHHDNAHEKNRSKTKRRRAKENHNGLYNELAFVEREPTGRPGTPHRFFSKSYRVTNPIQDTALVDLANCEEQSLSPSDNGQIVHQHANSLVIVTAGYLVRDELQKRQSQLCGKQSDLLKIQNFEFLQSVNNAQSVGAKRKKLKTGNGAGIWDTPGIVRPMDDIAVVTFSDGSTLNLKCCVAGTLLEINHRLLAFENDMKLDADDLVSLLVDDPLLDGYLAVVKPIGFPCNLI